MLSYDICTAQCDFRKSINEINATFKSFLKLFLYELKINYVNKF